VHSPLDQRIYYKEAQSLAAAGYDVTVIGPGDAALAGVHQGVTIRTMPRPDSVSGRLTNLLRLTREGWRSGADLYHLHDPELLPLGLLLRALGKKVIYDCHEHFPQVVYSRRWIPRLLQLPMSLMIDFGERLAVRVLNGVLGVVDEQRQRFGNCLFEAVKNYPRTELFTPNGKGAAPDDCELLHVGSLSRDRGSDFLLEVMRELSDTHPSVRLRTVGPFQTEADRLAFELKLEEYELQDRVECRTDPVPYDQLGELIARHRIGLIPGQPSVQNLTPFVPTKLFEYLACGIPVVASALPSIRSFYEAGDWGTLADPTDPRDHAAAIGHLLDHADESDRKGRRGRLLVEERFNWSAESDRLLNFYQRVW
jgi:glycosyltransferase involved in cell wall biosynthesis